MLRCYSTIDCVFPEWVCSKHPEYVYVDKWELKAFEDNTHVYLEDDDELAQYLKLISDDKSIYLFDESTIRFTDGTSDITCSSTDELRDTLARLQVENDYVWMLELDKVELQCDWYVDMSDWYFSTDDVEVVQDDLVADLFTGSTSKGVKVAKDGLYKDYYEKMRRFSDDILAQLFFTDVWNACLYIKDLDAGLIPEDYQVTVEDIKDKCWRTTTLDRLMSLGINIGVDTLLSHTPPSLMKGDDPLEMAILHYCEMHDIPYIPKQTAQEEVEEDNTDSELDAIIRNYLESEGLKYLDAELEIPFDDKCEFARAIPTFVRLHKKPFTREYMVKYLKDMYPYTKTYSVLGYSIDK